MPLVSYRMEPTINNGIHLVAAFPMSTQNPEFVLALANKYDSTTKFVKYADRKMLIKLDEDLFDTIFKCSLIDQYADIDMQSMVAYFDKNSEKYEKNMNENWLKTPRPTISRWPKNLPHCDFIKEVNDLITLLSRVKGLPTSNTYHKWKYQYIHVIRQNKKKIF